MWNDPGMGDYDDGFGGSPFDFEPGGRFGPPKYMPPPVFHTFCSRCKAPVELRGPGEGQYKAYDAGEGGKHTNRRHRCNRSADIDEFEVLTDD